MDTKTVHTKRLERLERAVISHISQTRSRLLEDPFLSLPKNEAALQTILHHFEEAVVGPQKLRLQQFLHAANAIIEQYPNSQHDDVQQKTKNDEIDASVNWQISLMNTFPDDEAQPIADAVLGLVERSDVRSLWEPHAATRIIKEMFDGGGIDANTNIEQAEESTETSVERLEDDINRMRKVIAAHEELHAAAANNNLVSILQHLQSMGTSSIDTADTNTTAEAMAEGRRPSTKRCTWLLKRRSCHPTTTDIPPDTDTMFIDQMKSMRKAYRSEINRIVRLRPHKWEDSKLSALCSDSSCEEESPSATSNQNASPSNVPAIPLTDNTCRYDGLSAMRTRRSLIGTANRSTELGNGALLTSGRLSESADSADRRPKTGRKTFAHVRDKNAAMQSRVKSLMARQLFSGSTRNTLVSPPQ